MFVYMCFSECGTIGTYAILKCATKTYNPKLNPRKHKLIYIIYYSLQPIST